MSLRDWIYDHQSLVRVLLGGAFAGIIWSLLPGFLTQLLKSDADVVPLFVAGALAGIAVAAILARIPLSGFWAHLIGIPMLALIAPCLGGWVFGFFLGFAPILPFDTEVAQRLGGVVTPTAYVGFAIYWIMVGWLVYPLALANVCAQKLIFERWRKVVR